MNAQYFSYRLNCKLQRHSSIILTIVGLNIDHLFILFTNTNQSTNQFKCAIYRTVNRMESLLPKQFAIFLLIFCFKTGSRKKRAECIEKLLVCAYWLKVVILIQNTNINVILQSCHLAKSKQNSNTSLTRKEPSLKENPFENQSKYYKKHTQAIYH